MKKRNNHSPIWILLALFVALSCSKDKGNYLYNDINDITISADADTFYVQQFDTLNIVPLITQRLPNDASLKYTWYIYGGNIVRDPVQVSDGRVLNDPIPVVPYNLPYSLMFRITDTTTGVHWYKEFKLYVSNALSQGWLILEKKPGGADVSMISPSDEVLRDIYSGANNGTLLPADAHRVISNKSITDQSNYVLFENGLVQMNKLDFSVLASYQDLFYELPPVQKPQAVAYQNTFLLPAQLLINNKQLYLYSALLGTGKLGAPLSGDYELAPFLALGSGTWPCVVFDQKNKRFLTLLNAFATALTPFSPSGGTPQPFDLNHIDKQLLHMDRGDAGNWNAIFRNFNNDSCFIYTINPNTTNHNLVAVGVQPMLDCPEIHRASGFGMSFNLPFVYYSVDNNVYLYDKLANQARLVHQFPADETITVLQMEHVSTGFWIPATPWENKRLVVATSKGEAGSVYYLNLNTTGDVENNTFSKKFDGFGTVVSMAYKVRS